MYTRVLAIVRALVAVGGGAFAVSGCSSAAAHGPAASAPTQVSIVAHAGQIEFITASGASGQFPTGPLAAGDRVLGRDDLLQAGSVVGRDYEVCTVAFDLHVLCDDMLSFTNKGDLHVTGAFQWPATGTRGPSTFEGVIDGGTFAYRNAAGDFHAVALPDRDIQITATFTQSIGLPALSNAELSRK